MPKMICKCVTLLRNGDIPCKIQYNFISDEEYDKFQDTIDAEELFMEMKIFFRCSQCGRLWFFWNGFDERPTEYIEVKE